MKMSGALPLIVAPGECARRLGEEADPGDLMRPFPAEPMRMWRSRHGSTDGHMSEAQWKLQHAKEQLAGQYPGPERNQLRTA
jgi:hypothetical protein